MNDRISACDYKKLLKTKRKPKYGNKRTLYNGRTYASEAEALWASRLDLLQKGGVILSWVPQCPRFPLTDADNPPTYTADFLIFLQGDRAIVADCKGFDTPESRLKRDIVKDRHGVTVHTVWGDVLAAIDPEPHRGHL